jgi:O-antigen biosynthesis protein
MVFRKMGYRIGIFLHLLFLSLLFPLRFVKKFSVSKFKVLFNALKNESPRQIIRNYRNYLLSLEPVFEIVEEKPISSKEIILEEKQVLLKRFLRGKEKLVFPFENPVLSIVIVLFNKAELSLACFRSLFENVTIAYQLIIVDNNSSDDTHALLQRIEGAEIIRNRENVHFLKANNQALSVVKGEYLLMLNNDTEVTINSINIAVETLKHKPRCGAVGAKLILPDGRLQEAGSIIWNDGSCLGYGRGLNPNAPEFNFLRAVDYCSGAFLLTRTNLFKEHGGFDNLFEPAYYEETDYCLWLEKKGFQVLYNPLVTIRHFEFGSGLHEHVIELHKKNQQLFFEKHSTQLKHHPAPDFDKLLTYRFAASDNKKRKLLYIDDRVPHNELGSGFPRSNFILNQIGGLDFHVTMYPMNFPFEDNWETAYRDIDPTIEVMLGYGFEKFEEFIRQRSCYYDYIWVSRPHNMQMILPIIVSVIPQGEIIYDAEAIFAQREVLRLRTSGREISKKQERLMIDHEIALSAKAKFVATVSEPDSQYFERQGKKTIVLGHTLQVKESIPSYSERKGLLFVGNLDYDHSPNVDSINWFVKEIFPLIKKEIPGITLDVVGSNNAPLLSKLKGEGITFHGRVNHLSEFYDRNRVFIAPTRFAAGIPYKVHEAASYGIPVVATSLLCEQLGWSDGDSIISSDITAKEFSDKLVNLYRNEESWTHISQKATEIIKREMSEEAFREKLMHLFS